jgi:hypothetical protein
LMMCAGLLLGGGDESKLTDFSGDMCYSYRFGLLQVGETKRNGKCSVVMCAVVTVMVCYSLERRSEIESVQKGILTC